MKLVKDYKIIFLIILLFVIVGILYAVYTQSWLRPDEFGHFSYIKYLQKYNSIPVYISVFDFWEAHQPPLYYLLNLPVAVIFSAQSITAQVIALRIFNLIFAIVNIFVLYRIYIYLAQYVIKEEWRKYFVRICLVLSAFWPMYLYMSSGINNDNLANVLGSLVIYRLLTVAQIVSDQKNQ